MKAFCIWCEMGDSHAPKGYFWIHQKCFEEITDAQNDVKYIKQHYIQMGEDCKKMEAFFDRMENFRQRWGGSMKIIKKMKGVQE